MRYISCVDVCPNKGLAACLLQAFGCLLFSVGSDRLAQSLKCSFSGCVAAYIITSRALPEVGLDPANECRLSTKVLAHHAINLRNALDIEREPCNLRRLRVEHMPCTLDSRNTTKFASATGYYLCSSPERNLLRTSHSFRQVALSRCTAASHSVGSAMKITNPSSVVADTAVTVSYVVESGDPQSFFFDIFVEQNGGPGFRLNVSSGQLFSGSGSFQTTPGYTGGHYIEAYEPSATIGETPPFATGPTYDVLDPGSTPTTAPPASPTTATTAKSSPTVQAPTTTTTVAGGGGGGGGSTQTSLGSSQVGDVVDDATSLLASETQPPPAAFTVTRSGEGSGLSVIEIVAGSGTVAVQTQQTGSVTSLSSSPSAVSAASEPPARAHTDTGVIVGAVVGALVLLALLLLVGRRFRRRQPEDIQFEPAFMVSSRHPTVAPFLGFAVPSRSSASATNEKRATSTLSAAALARLGFLRLPDSSSAPAAADPTTPATAVNNAKRLGHTISKSRASTLSETSTLASRTGESSVAFTPMPIANSTHATSTIPSPAALAPNTTTGMQMEWVLRATTDPPPGYSDTQVSS
uniref:Uncharacterized protein n=1 Tax=Mycena chlorophos TaxID=658473 RepID=A0ABQ0M8K3_MYCCL|nr:predicted protein [Mycena chlorophos]